VGGHSTLGNNVRIDAYAAKNPIGTNGVRNVVISVYNPSTGKWVQKVNRFGEVQLTTLFPESWSRSRIIVEVDIAYNNKIVDEITRAKLKYITIEDLKVSNMIKNKHLSKAIQEQNFYAIRTKLINKCKERNIELRLVDTFYPSSKTCSCCGSVKKDLKLNDRIYKCYNCGIEIDRDYNASINLEKAKVYKIIA